MRGLVLAAAVLAASGAARAAVVDAQPNGFQVQQTVEIAAPAAKVWTALGHVGGWWAPEHTWSHDAKNLSLDLALGGCFCETFPAGGGARHLTVVNISPMSRVVLEGALGPMSVTGSDGHLIWALAEKDGRTTLTQTYAVGGYYKGGYAELAPVVDRVLSEQIDRLKRYVETGAP